MAIVENDGSLSKWRSKPQSEYNLKEGSPDSVGMLTGSEVSLGKLSMSSILQMTRK